MVNTINWLKWSHFWQPKTYPLTVFVPKDGHSTCLLWYLFIWNTLYQISTVVFSQWLSHFTRKLGPLKRILITETLSASWLLLPPVSNDYYKAHGTVSKKRKNSPMILFTTNYISIVDIVCKRPLLLQQIRQKSHVHTKRFCNQRSPPEKPLGAKEQIRFSSTSKKSGRAGFKVFHCQRHAQRLYGYSLRTSQHNN